MKVSKQVAWLDQMWEKFPLDVQAAAYAIAQRCKGEDDYPLSRLARWFYTGKALACLLLNRRADLWLKDRITVAEFDFEEWASMEWGRMVEWDMLVVSYGWRDWHVCILHDGAP